VGVQAEPDEPVCQDHGQGVDFMNQFRP
jgi:hypothetical protein